MPNAKKLRYKLIAVVTVLMTATLVAVAAITHSQSLAVIREQSLTLNSRLVEAGVEKLGTSYSQLNNLFQSIYLNENFEAFLRTRGRREGHSTFQDAALMKTVFLSTLSSRSDLYSIIFVDWNGRLFYATRDEAGFWRAAFQRHTWPSWRGLTAGSMAFACSRRSCTFPCAATGPSPPMSIPPHGRSSIRKNGLNRSASCLLPWT